MILWYCSEIGMDFKDIRKFWEDKLPDKVSDKLPVLLPVKLPYFWVLTVQIVVLK